VKHVLDVVSRTRPLDGFTVVCNLTYITSKNLEDGIRAARPFAERFLSFPGIGETLLEHSGFDPEISTQVRKGSFERVTPEIIQEMAVIGNRDKLSERLRVLESLGVDFVVMGTDSLLREEIVSEKIVF
jgi:hypothetical protein